MNDFYEDIYFQEEYVSLYLRNKGDSIFRFEHVRGEYACKNVAIKRPILTVAGTPIAGEWFDLETPYGYGGFCANTNCSEFVEEALDHYLDECRKQRIVAEFFRFHPFSHTHELVRHRLSFHSHDRDTAFVDLARPYDAIFSEYRASLRRDLRKASEKLAFQELSPTAGNLRLFCELYTSTMARNQANEVYYFGSEYFEKLAALDEARLFAAHSDGKIVSIVSILANESFVHYHLSANSPEAYALNANAFLLDEIIKQYAMTPRIFHLGGGTSTRADDPLLWFKRKFTPRTAAFSIGGLVYDSEQYHKLNELRAQTGDDSKSFFLKYRLPVATGSGNPVCGRR